MNYRPNFSLVSFLSRTHAGWRCVVVVATEFAGIVTYSATRRRQIS